MNLSDADFLEIEREYCRRSLAAFAKQAWKILEPATPLKWGWAVQSICDHLEAVTEGKIKRLLMNVPPGSMKSLLVSVIWPAWEWGPRGMPEKRFLSTAHKQDLAIRDSTKSRRLIQSAWFQKLWPLQLTGDQNAKTKFENEKTGFRESMAFTSMTGARGDRVILDDPHSVDDANSAAKLAADIVTFREALPSRVNNEESAIIIIMQRLAVGDVSDVALGLGYQHLCIPMRYEVGCSKHVVGDGDPRRVDGELMFPERFSEQQVAELEQSLGSYATAGQLQQRPSPRGGGFLKDAWWQYYVQEPQFEWRAIYADTAQKTQEQHDYTVFQCWGYTGGRAYLIDQLRGKWEAPELLINARAFWNKHNALKNGSMRGFNIEDKSSGTGLIQQLKVGDRQKGHPAIPVKAVQRNRDKITRAMDAAPIIEAGLVYLPQNASWLSDFLAEASVFPNGAHDDQLDPMMDALNGLKPKSYTWDGF